MDTPEPNPEGLTVALFGPMQVLAQGRPLPPLRSRKSLWLLALLVLRHDRPVAREWLAGVLWPDVEQSSAFANLRVVLSELRKALGAEGARLQSPNRHTVLLEGAAADMDVARFDAAIASGKPAALHQAIALYKGPLLEGCSEEWVFQERAVREQNVLTALQTLGDLSFDAGDYSAAAERYQQAARLDPFHEAARRGAMQALAKSGDRNAALQIYREYAALLRRDDPHAAPDPETSELYARLRADTGQASPPRSAVPQREAVAEAPAATGYLPCPLTEIIGREDERREVTALLRRSRLVTLTGTGGIGKTRLALAVAAESAEEYADGAWFVGLESLAAGAAVMPQIAAAFGLRETPGRSLSQNLTDALRKKRTLLVLDNCEHLLEASAAAAAALLRECAGLRILTTSREPLGITGETVWAAPPLSAPERGGLPPQQATMRRVLMGYESVRLFMERAQSAQKSFALTENNALAIAEICAQLEGIPLALEFAAARVKAMTAEQIAARLKNEIGLLSGGNSAAPPRQRALRAALDWSYALLTEPEQVLLRRLSVFSGGWNLEAAESVCPGPPVEARQTLDLLTSLVDKSLVVFEERDHAAGGRYRLLEITRQYAAESLLASGEQAAVKARHWNWCLALSEDLEAQLVTAGQENAMRRMDAEQDNMRAALEWGLPQPQEGEAALRLVSAWMRYWDTRGHYSAGRRYLERALALAGDRAAPALRAKALNAAGALAVAQGDYAATQALHEESLLLRRQGGNEVEISEALGNMGNLAYYQEDYAKARTCYKEVLGLFQKRGDTIKSAWALNSLGSVAREEGDYAAAQTLFEESLRLRRQAGIRLRVAQSLGNLGGLVYLQGRYAEARALLEEALTHSREVEDPKSVAGILYDLSRTARREGDLETALCRCEEGLRICREMGDRHGIALSLQQMGRLAGDAKQYPRARTLLTESLSIFHEIGAKREMEKGLRGLAETLLAQGTAQEAARLWGALHQLRENLGVTLTQYEQADYIQQIRQAQSALGEAAFTQAREEGRALSLEQAIACALQNVVRSSV